MSQAEGPGSPEPTARLLRMLGGKWLAATISAASSLDLFSALASGPMTLERLADRLACQPGSLHRMLRVLVGEGLISINSRREYELTELGDMLRSGELSALASFIGASFNWDPWSGLAESVRSGESAFAKHHGEGLFEYLENHQEDALLYHAAIDAFCRDEARDVAKTFDFSTASRVADIGGGRGTLLIEVLSAWNHLSGLLIERPVAVEAARTAFFEAGIEERCKARVSDYFVELPKDADVLVLKHIIHSWDDTTAIELLSRCANAITADGRILVIEGLLLPEGHQNITSLLDLEMLVLCGGGHERSKPEMRRLLSAAGLRLIESMPLAGGSYLFVTGRRSA